MHKITQRVGTVIAAGTLLASLAACSGTGGGSGDNTIEIWYRPGSLPAASIDGVQKQFPDVKIKLIKSPDADTKLQAALRANNGVPDIAVANIYTLAPVADKFADVNEYGFKDVAADYLDWKVKGAQDGKGRQIGIPIDIGPEGFFYRADVFQKLGLPSDPAEVGKLVSTWDGYAQVAEKVTGAQAGFVCDAADSSLYTPKIFGTGSFYYKDGKPAIDTAANKDAFVSSVKFGQKKQCLNAEPYSQEWSAGIAQNKLVGWVGPAYQAALMNQAGGTSSGQWRVTTPPGGSSSQLGSNISVFKASKNPKLATQIAEWLTNPKNQAAGYKADALFPSTPSSYMMNEMSSGDPFFGGQVTSEVLAKVATTAPAVAVGSDSTVIQAAFGTAMTDAITTGQDSEAAYAEALKKAQG